MVKQLLQSRVKLNQLFLLTNDLIELAVYSHEGSMGLVYLPTLLVYVYILKVGT